MRITLGITLFLGLVLFSCNKPPEACITTSNESPAVGTEVELSATCSEKAKSYIWSFEGPSSSIYNNIQRSEQVIMIAFDTAGTYTVTLDVFKEFSWLGESASTQTTLTVN